MSIILSIQPTLQALLLSLKDLEALSLSEIEKFKSIADRLATGQNWERDIQPELIEIINENTLLEQQFKQAKNKLEKMSEDEIISLFPTVNDLEKVISSKLSVINKSKKPTGKVDRDGDHIANMVIEVLATEDPVKATQELFQEKEKNQPKNQTKHTNPCQ